MAGTWIYLTALLTSVTPLTSTGCAGVACTPLLGNLAWGREVRTVSQCGGGGAERVCGYSGGGCVMSCQSCEASVPRLAHPPSYMTDSPLTRPETWWGSAVGVSVESVQLDLEAEFFLTHLIIIFASPRPAVMVLERSRDFGRSWSELMLYARDCGEAFGRRDGRGCTQKYSSAWPCSHGEVIYRALWPWDGLDPYGVAARARLGVTNLRVRLLRPQPCPCQLNASLAAAAHYAIYDLIVSGGCLCHGHADQCVPARAARHAQHMVQGKCVCQHHTTGRHCERCLEMFNDQPWRPASAITGHAHACVKCRCNGHAERCVFDERAWHQSGGRSGGVCVCGDNTAGRHCQRCVSGFYRDPARPPTAPDSCAPCGCDPVGSVRCDPASGACICVAGVAGPRCERCMLGYWGFSGSGCRPCDCSGDCDPRTGACGGRSALGSSGSLVFGTEELFSALSPPDKCVCKPQELGNYKALCKIKQAFAVKARVRAAHDRGSHAEVDVTVMKVLWINSSLRISPGNHTLYPESWTSRGCTCPVLYPGLEYLVIGQVDVRKARLMVNMKSLVKPWRASLSRKVQRLRKTTCS